MSPYLILALIIVGIVIITWFIALIVENNSNSADGGWYLAAGIITFFVVLFGTIFGGMEIAEREYRSRIAEKYEIAIVSSLHGNDEYHYAVYAKGDCVARKAPNDVLYQVGCVEGGFREVGE